MSAGIDLSARGDLLLPLGAALLIGAGALINRAWVLVVPSAVGAVVVIQAIASGRVTNPNSSENEIGIFILFVFAIAIAATVAVAIGLLLAPLFRRSRHRPPKAPT